jgi:mRNA interferase RelE/StbE
MANYSVVVKKSVTKDLRNIPNKDVERILKRINSLSENPRSDGCIKLSGQERYRIRQGIYRIVYEIQDSELVILIVKVAHHGEIYQSG